jgi:hypothetical protein
LPHESESSSLQKLIDDLPPENQMDAQTYLNIDDAILNDGEDISDNMVENAILSSDSEQSTGHEAPKITYSEAIKACETLILFLEQQHEDQYNQIRELKSLYNEICYKSDKKKVQRSILNYINKNI